MDRVVVIGETRQHRIHARNLPEKGSRGDRTARSDEHCRTVPLGTRCLSGREDFVPDLPRAGLNQLAVGLAERRPALDRVSARLPAQRPEVVAVVGETAVTPDEGGIFASGGDVGGQV